MPEDDDDKKKKTPKNPATDVDDDDEGGDDKPLTGKQVNAAITKAVRGTEKRMLKQFGDTIAKTLADAGVIKKPAADDDGDGDGDGDGDDDAPAKTPAAQQPAARPAGKSKAERELAKVKADMAKLTGELAEKDRKAQREELKRLTTEHLTALNVRKESIPLLVTHLLSEDGGQRVRRSTDGAPVFLLTDDDEQPLKDGFAAWSKTDEGKSYIAPRSVQGGGGANGQQPQRRVGQPAGGQGGGNGDTVSKLNNDLMNAVISDMGGFILGGDSTD